MSLFKHQKPPLLLCFIISWNFFSICGGAMEMMLIMVVPDFWDVLLWGVKRSLIKFYLDEDLIKKNLIVEL